MPAKVLLPWVYPNAYKQLSAWGEGKAVCWASVAALLRPPKPYAPELRPQPPPPHAVPEQRRAFPAARRGMSRSPRPLAVGQRDGNRNKAPSFCEWEATLSLPGMQSFHFQRFSSFRLWFKKAPKFTEQLQNDMLEHSAESGPLAIF